MTIIRFGLALILLAGGTSGSLCAQDTFSPAHLKRAVELHRRYVVLDAHSDVTPKLEDSGWDFAARHDSGHMDIPRLRDGGFGAQIFSIYMGKTPGEGRAIRKALMRIDALYQAVRKHPADLEMAGTAADVRRIKKTGRIACLMGIEGGHIIEDSLPALRMFHRLGCRYMTLTHTFNTSWADSSGLYTDAKGEHGGLTEFGEKIVHEMNRLGMMVDISHVSDATLRDALRVTTAPVIASHSSARGVHDHRRNISDDMLKAIGKNGGVVMINFFNMFIDPGYEKAQKSWETEHKAALDAMTKKFRANRRAYYEARRGFSRKHPMRRTPLVVLARHVEHVARLIGWEHVGIGADWDGVSWLPEGIDHCGHLPKLTALLLARGAKESQIELFLGESLLRVLERCEQVAASMR